MTQINPNFDNKYRFAQQQQEFQSVSAEQNLPEEMIPEVQMPSLYSDPYYLSENKTVKEKIKEADMMGLVYPWIEHPILMAGTAAGLAYGVDKFAKACGGEYEKSLVGKAANFGDKVENSKLIQSKPFQSVLSLGKTGVKKVGHFFRNSDLINAIRKTPSQPEWTIVKDELLSMEQRQVYEFSRIVNKLKLLDTVPVPLGDLRVDKEEKEFLKTLFNNVSVTSEQKSNAIQLKNLGIPNDEILKIVSGSDATSVVKTKQLEALGLSADELKKITTSKNITEDQIKAVKKACQNAKGIRVGEGHYKFLGPFQIFKRSIGLDEIYNRLHSMTDGAKTTTGRNMAKFLQKCHRGFTFGGGKLGVLAFVSPLLVETMLDTKKADSSQKIGTAAHGIVEACSWVFTFPLALSIMHHLAGVQYAGMSKDNVLKCRELIRQFNEKVTDGKTYLNNHDLYKKDLKDLKGELKKLKEVKGQNLLTKICKKMGSFLTLDLENIKSYRGGTFAGNAIRKVPSFFRNFAGIPMRFGVWGALSIGVLGTAITKGVKTLFGNYYDRYKEEEHQALKKEQKTFTKMDLQERLVEAQRRKVMGVSADNAKSDNKKDIAQPENPLVNNTSEEAAKNIKEKMMQNSVETSQTKITNNNKEITPITQPEQKNVQETAPVKADTTVKLEAIADIEKKYIPDQNPNPNLFKPKTTTKRDNYTYIPSSENVLNKNKDSQDKNKYIPSQERSQFSKTFDNSGLEAALRRADRAEAKAIKILSGNFN